MEEAEQKPDQIQRTRKQDLAAVLLLLCPCLVLAGLSLVYVAQIDVAEGAAQSADYHRAPGCTPTAVASSGLPPCQMQMMTVTTKNQVDGGDGPDTYKLGLRSPGGAGQEVTLVGPSKSNLFASVGVGGTVQAKVWQGEILILNVPGWHCGTPNHPDAQLASGERSLVAGGLCTLLGGFGLFYRWWTRKREHFLLGSEETD